MQSKKLEQTASLLIFGEILFDTFPNGKRVLGGAPFNVAWHLQGLGQKPLMTSAVGKDSFGDEITREMTSWGMTTTALQQHANLPTGEVTVTFNGNEPQYDIKRPRAWDDIIDDGFAADGLIYHGSLGLRSKQNQETLRNIITRSPAQRFVDLNVRMPYFNIQTAEEWIHGITWLKLNKDELDLLSQSENVSIEEIEASIRRVRDQYKVGNILLTLGSDGAIVRGDYGNAEVIPAPEPPKFVDAVGAGDSLAAVMILGIQDNQPIQQLLSKASHFASKVCGLNGATTKDTQFYTN